MTRSLYSWLLIAIVVSCHTPKQTPQSAVVSARAEASQIGIDILKKGGNAFDAMIATHLALVFVIPMQGILVAVVLVYRKADGTIGSLDYREKAPASADRDMYLDTAGNVIPDKSTLGGLAVGVPGSVAGLTAAIHEKLGSLPFKDLVQPAIELAENGYVVTEKTSPKFLK